MARRSPVPIGGDVINVESKERAWSPVCAGRLAAAATEAVLAIARDLRVVRVDDASLTGQAGLALLYAYLARAFPGCGHDAVADEHLDAAVAMLPGRPTRPALHGGFTGVAWCVEHVRPAASDSPDDDANAEIDAVLSAVLRRSPWPGEYDLISGLVGLAVYAFERLPRPGALACAELVIDRLAELARPLPHGLAWWSDPQFLPPRPDVDPAGTYNLGVAHGVPGVIAVLATACTVPALAGKARPLLDGAVAWLFAQRLPRHQPGWFGFRAGDTVPARTAWCYGDLGIAATLQVAADQVGSAAWHALAVELALHTLERPPDETGVRDAALCHGAAGLAHVYNRFYQVTGDARFGDAARQWCERILEMRTPDTGPGGFLALRFPEPGQEAWEADPGFLTGACGIALVLLAATTNIAPDWDRALLCSAVRGGARAASR